MSGITRQKQRRQVDKVADVSGYWAEQCLVSGKATGNIIFRADNGGRLQVRYSRGRGRGLFAASAFKPGDLITTAVTDDTNTATKSTSLEYLQVSKTKVLPLLPPTPSTLANVVNCNLTGTNNAKFSKTKLGGLKVIAKTHIPAGSEITAAYGRQYSARLKTLVEEEAEEQQKAKVMQQQQLALLTTSNPGFLNRRHCAGCKKLLTKASLLTHLRTCAVLKQQQQQQQQQ